MKITINEIPDSGLELSEDKNAKEWGIETTEVTYTEPVNVYAQVTKNENIIKIQVSATGTMNMVCGRCLLEEHKPLDVVIELYYEATATDIVDLEEKIREEILLNYPAKVLCNDSCKGLCDICGKNLNNEKCDCHKTWDGVHIRFIHPSEGEEN